MSQTPRRSAGSRMMLALAVALLACGFAETAASQTVASNTSVGGACDKARYKALLQTGIAGMGHEEYPFFLELDAACRTHKRDMAQVVAGSPEQFNPCIHPPYASLAASKKPRDMTEREYGYFSVVDRECEVYQQSLSQDARATAAVTPSQPTAGRRWFTGLLAAGAILATLVASLN